MKIKSGYPPTHKSTQHLIGVEGLHEGPGDVGGGHRDDVVEGDDDGGLVVDAGYAAFDAFEDALGDPDVCTLDEFYLLDIYTVYLVGIELCQTDEVDHGFMGYDHADAESVLVLLGMIIDEMEVGYAVVGFRGVGVFLNNIEGGKDKKVAGEDRPAGKGCRAIGGDSLDGFVWYVGKNAIFDKLLLCLEVPAVAGIHEEPLVVLRRNIVGGNDVLRGKDIPHWLPQSVLF